jgi:GDP-D-mannose dehydratase
MDNKALITGITGFVGSHLSDYILEHHKDTKIYGLTRWRSPLDNIKHILDKVQLVNGDLNDQGSLIRVLDEVKPDLIFHLAAQSYVVTSFNYPIETLQVNILGTTNLLEAVRILGIDPVIGICSSSEVYGQVRKEDVPITEDCPLRPASPYGVSKVGEDLIAYQYWLSYKMKTIRSRSFTHSVSKWTPVIIKDSRSGLLDIKYISEIRSIMKKGGYLSGKMIEGGVQTWDMRRHNLEIWNDNKWTKIEHISCHPINNRRLLEIACIGGVVDVTDNHSIIGEDGNKVNAGDVCLNQKLKLTPLPNVEITSMPEDLAWLYGFFVAEGCVTGGRMRIDNNDLNRLRKSQAIILKYLAAYSVIRELCSNNTSRLSVLKPFKVAKRFYQDCYASDRNKRIPKIILNSDRNTKIAFLRGYNEGDGNIKNKINSEFYNFKTKSPILAMGLCYLVESVLKVKYRITVEHRGDDRYFEVRCLSQLDTKQGNHFLKDDNSVIKITELKYSDEVWDFETENHWFHAGIGGNIVHNTGPRRGEVFVLSNFAKQVALIEAGLQEPIIKVGNLDSVRTFMDVRDTVRAYWLLKDCPSGEVYNIGGDEAMNLHEMLDRLLSVSRVKNIKLEVDPTRLRPSDVTLQIPDSSKFRKATGWKPEIKFEQTIKDILDYWRSQNAPR